MLLIYAIYSITIITATTLFLLFMFLMFRKIWLRFQQVRDKRYTAYIFPKLIEYVSHGEEGDIRLFFHMHNWKKRVNLQLLIQLSERINDETGRARIYQLCSKLGYPEVLRQQLKHKHWWKRAEALRLIGQLRLAPLSACVAEHLYDAQYDVWTTAARTLTVLDCNRTVLEFLIERTHILKDQAAIRIVDILKNNISDEDILFMVKRIDEAPRLLQGLFLDLFAQARRVSALPTVEAYLVAADGELRLKALKALAEIGLTTRENEVLAFLDSNNWLERMQAVRIVRACSMYQAMPKLEELLADSQWWVRYRAAEALKNFGSSGKQRLLEASRHHSDAYARDMAKQMLGL